MVKAICFSLSGQPLGEKRHKASCWDRFFTVYKVKNGFKSYLTVLYYFKINSNIKMLLKV